MDLDLDTFADLVAANDARWTSAGVRWELHRGPTRDKSAAWIICTSAEREAQLTVWTSGEAELDIVETSAGTLTSKHYDLSSTADLTACLDDLLHRLTSPTSGT
jgi:hypothetical protein